MTTSSTRELDINGYNLSITTRNQTDSIEIMEELTFRTVSAWLFIADLLERQVYEIKAEGSIEGRFMDDKGIALRDNFGEPRVTVWSTYRGNRNPHFNLNSDDNTQAAIDTWVAQRNALERVTAKYAQTAPQSHTEPPPAGASANPLAATQNIPLHGVMPVNGKSKAKELATGQQFSMRIVQVAAAMSKTGVMTYELYCAYGGKPGQYPDLLVYSDNEHAVASGLVGKLAALGLKAGGSMTGAWFVVGNVYESNGKKGLNVNQLEVVQA